MGFGRKNCQGVVYSIDETTGGLSVSHKLVLPTKDYPGCPGPVTGLRLVFFLTTYETGIFFIARFDRTLFFYGMAANEIPQFTKHFLFILKSILLGMSY